MDDFDVALQQVIEERKTILFEIERAVFTKRYSLSSKHYDIFSKQSISMIYAIWEGFVQRSFNLYIDELNKELDKVEIRFDDFCDEILIYHMENSFKQLKQYPRDNRKKIELFKKLREFYSENKPISRMVDTESNVGFEVLNKLLQTFSLEPFPEHWQNYTHPDPNLKESLRLFLRLRNTVAHGNDLLAEDTIDQNTYSRFKVLVQDLMYEIRLKMLKGLAEKTFLQRE